MVVITIDQMVPTIITILEVPVRALILETVLVLMILLLMAVSADREALGAGLVEQVLNVIQMIIQMKVTMAIIRGMECTITLRVVME